MISIALTIFLVLIVLALFVYSMAALLKKDIYLEQLKLSKKDGLQLSFHVKEKERGSTDKKTSFCKK